MSKRRSQDIYQRLEALLKHKNSILFISLNRQIYSGFVFLYHGLNWILQIPNHALPKYIIMLYYLSIGSNLGNKIKYLEIAIEQITKLIGPIKRSSSYYATAPWGRGDIHPFINACLIVETKSIPHDVLERIQIIEMNLGRERNEKWGNRTIDIDILFCDDNIYNTSNLVIPHPLIQERKFVLSPLLEIAPTFVHPVLHKTIEELYIHHTLQ